MSEFIPLLKHSDNCVHEVSYFTINAIILFFIFFKGRPEALMYGCTLSTREDYRAPAGCGGGCRGNGRAGGNDPANLRMLRPNGPEPVEPNGGRGNHEAATICQKQTVAAR